ncbi:MAG: hypothetical protein WDO72_13800 [Pseudomonadota bacterium]
MRLTAPGPAAACRATSVLSRGQSQRTLPGIMKLDLVCCVSTRESCTGE